MYPTLVVLIVVLCCAVAVHCFALAVIGLDFIAAGNFTSVPVPKYNNKVLNPDIFDKSTRILLPRSMLHMPTTGKYNSVLSYWLAFLSFNIFAYLFVMDSMFCITEHFINNWGRILFLLLNANLSFFCNQWFHNFCWKIVW